MTHTGVDKSNRSGTIVDQVSNPRGARDLIFPLLKQDSPVTPAPETTGHPVLAVVVAPRVGRELLPGCARRAWHL